MGAGTYRTPFEWQKRTAGTKDAFGARTDTYPAQGTLWGQLDEPSGGRGTAQESERAEYTSTVRFRNYPAVSAGDRLVDDLGAVWTVESAVRGSNELVVDVARPRFTPQGGTA
jgi:head-tail adaptor